MKRLLHLTSALVFAAGSASALGFGGGQLTLGYDIQTEDGDSSTPHIEGSVILDVSDKFALQFDLNTSYYDDGGADMHTSYGIHASYDVLPNLTAGLFYSYEDWDGSPYQYYGIEGRFDINALMIEAFIIFSDDEDTSWGANLRYDLSQKLDILGGFVAHDDLTYIYAGAAYQLTSSLAVEATYGNMSSNFDDYDVITLDLVYRFGGGTAWSQRSYTPTLPAW